MSSIRPLFTISVLALVGAFLFLKINETEPPLPEGVENWAADTELDIDMDIDSMGIGEENPLDVADVPGMAPAFATDTQVTTSTPPSLPTGPPPTFDPSAATNSSVATTPPSTGIPPWPQTPAPAPAEIATPKIKTPELPAIASAPEASSVSNVEANLEARLAEAMQSEMPSLPPVPATFPNVTSSAPAASAAPAVASAPAIPSQPAIGSAPTFTDSTLLPGTSVTTTPALDTTLPVNSAPPVSSAPTTAVPTTPTPTTLTQESLFSAARLEVHAALDRGQLSQALLLLSDWYGDPSLSPAEKKEVDTLLGQLAGSVIYSTEPRLEPYYMVQTGDQLETIAKEYQVPWQLLAKINGISGTDQLQPGQKLKVVRGPFSAMIDISQRKLTLMLGRRYAGQFPLNIDPTVTVEEGHWEVKQKLVTPTSVSVPGIAPAGASEERSLMLANAAGGAQQMAILRSSANGSSLTGPAERVLRLSSQDAQEVYDILSLGSKVVIRR